MLRCVTAALRRLPSPQTVELSLSHFELSRFRSDFPRASYLQEAYIMARKRICIRNNRSECDVEEEVHESVISQMSAHILPSARKKRGFTRMADVWNLPSGSQILVTFNEVHQPVGVEGTVLKRFIGSMKRSAIGKENRSKQTSTHTAGTKTYAQHAYEMARLEELMSQCPDNSHGGSGGGILWDKNDIYSQVIGKDGYRYVRGLGFGPTPSMKDSVSSCACHGTRINIQEERLQTQEAMRQMSEKIQMLEAQVATLMTNFNQNTVVPFASPRSTHSTMYGLFLSFPFSSVNGLVWKRRKVSQPIELYFHFVKEAQGLVEILKRLKDQKVIYLQEKL
ncbi:E3 ubiquitin-protein ligase CHIP [Senna tora]|uniref:E3 ubiquitin-protein ligase CHIP n=1 Tax=Senna tora TaxID=362788 RepID=A0A834X7B0_9FABA|nr:E3 ubiquitin-protein ligase CHIP [Senna tora]